MCTNFEDIWNKSTIYIVKFRYNILNWRCFVTKSERHFIHCEFFN